MRSSSHYSQTRVIASTASNQQAHVEVLDLGVVGLEHVVVVLLGSKGGRGLREWEVLRSNNSVILPGGRVSTRSHRKGFISLRAALILTEANGQVWNGHAAQPG